MKNPQLQWLGKNLFSTWYNTLLTIICLLLILWMGRGIWDWTVNQAQWQVIQVNLHLFLVGRYPSSQYWRIGNVLAIASSLTALSWGVFTAQEKFNIYYYLQQVIFSFTIQVIILSFY